MSHHSILRRTVTVLGITAIMLVILAGVGVVTAAAAEPVEVSAKLSAEGNLTVIDINVANNTDNWIMFEIRAALPETGKLVYAWPQQYRLDGGTIVWTNPKKGISAGGKLKGFQYKVDGAAGNIVVTVSYWGKSSGMASTGPIAVPAK